MNKTEREQIRRLVADFKQWGQRAEELGSWHRAVHETAASSERHLRSLSVEITRTGEAAWRVAPLETDDVSIVKHLWERANLPETTPGDRALLRLLSEDAHRAIAEVGPVLGVRRFLTGSAKKQSAEA